MKQSLMLTITSLLSILFITFHLADDIVFEMASPRFASLFAVLVLVIWLYGALVLAERRAAAPSPRAKRRCCGVSRESRSARHLVA